MAATGATKEQIEEIDYSEAEEVDAEYEYLLKNKDKGITEEELEKKRAAKRLANSFQSDRQDS